MLWVFAILTVPPVELTAMLNRFLGKAHSRRRCTNSVGANQDSLTVKRMKLRFTTVFLDTMRMFRAVREIVPHLTDAWNKVSGSHNLCTNLLLRPNSGY